MAKWYLGDNVGQTRYSLSTERQVSSMEETEVLSDDSNNPDHSCQTAKRPDHLFASISSRSSSCPCRFPRRNEREASPAKLPSRRCCDDPIFSPLFRFLPPQQLQRMKSPSFHSFVPSVKPGWAAVRQMTAIDIMAPSRTMKRASSLAIALPNPWASSATRKLQRTKMHIVAMASACDRH